MTVYLLHLEPAFGHARHYLGSTDDLEHRLHMHRIGKGARMLAAARAVGVRWRLVRTWEGGRAEEARLKRRHNSPHYCPVCTPAARGGSRETPAPVLEAAS